jgi:ectoine hydroxylase-related dioxygenase (phytanoyl-CoA dioxygenase family)
VLTEHQRATYDEQGWVVLDGVLAPDELAPVIAALANLFPTGDDYFRDPAAYAHLRGSGAAATKMWPTRDLVLDLLPKHPVLVALAEELVGSTDLRLLRSTYWAKYAGAADYDQSLHLDYPNQSLVVPDEDEMVSFFLFLSDVTADNGPTKILPRPHGARRAPDVPRYRRDEAADVYEHEQDALGTVGSVLAYDSAVYHRGSALRAERGYRLSLTYAYGVPRPWSGHQSWPRLGENPGTEAFLVAATPRQRTLLGFPAIDDPYWTDSTIDLVQRRYPAMDMSPYRPQDAGSPGAAVS